MQCQVLYANKVSKYLVTRCHVLRDFSRSGFVSCDSINNVTICCVTRARVRACACARACHPRNVIVDFLHRCREANDTEDWAKRRRRRGRRRRKSGEKKVDGVDREGYFAS